MGSRAAAIVGVVAAATAAATAAAVLRARARLAQVAQSGSVLVGVDVGGTAIKAALVQLDGNVLAELEEPLRDASFSGVCEQVADLVRNILATPDALTNVRLEGVGLCVPGLVDAEAGQVLFAANFPTWPRPAPLTQRLGELLGRVPSLDNDANAALCAEIWRGAAKNERDVVLLTLGTGIGSAILSGGQLVRGASNAAGELGHTILVPNGDRVSERTGVRGIFEDYASARAVEEIAKEAVVRGDEPASALHEIAARGEKITCKRVFELAAGNAGKSQGDPLARRIVSQTGDYLGIASINITRTFDPAVILFGGGMTRAGDQLLGAIQAGFRKHHWTLSKPTCKLALAALGPEAGAIGAAYLAHPKHKKT